MKINNFVFLIILMILNPSCNDKNKTDWEKEISSSYWLYYSIEALTDVMVDNIFSPPVAARIYAYPMIAAYECARHIDPDLQSYATQLNGLDQIPEAESPDINFNLAAIFAFNKVARSLIFTEEMLVDNLKKQDSLLNSLNIPRKVMIESEKYADQVVLAINQWKDKDNYHELRSAPKYQVDFDNEARWIPTPPAFIEAVEPAWNQIRPMVLVSADQFKPQPPMPFSLDKESSFYKSVLKVYHISKTLTDEQKEIAGFWDCNPYTMHITGHVMVATKKISPGGHWINIGIISCRKINADMVRSLEILSQLSICIFDAFISCWDEKYRSALVRPETVINKHIDSEWRPLLQTPPFPEYTSGHSVVSAASAVCLKTQLGENFEFTDDSEVKYGLGIRKFASFDQAAEEASLSRLYGGIHYMEAIEMGMQQGKDLGNYVTKKLYLSK